MKKIVPFVKDLNGKTTIGEITNISLEHTLKLNGQFVSGEFIITGTYKMLEESLEEEKFDYKIPVDITIDSKYDTKDCTIGIDDFNYEIINEEIIRVNIDVVLDNLEIKQDEIETIEVESFDRNMDTLVEEISYDDKKEENKENKQNETFIPLDKTNNINITVDENNKETNNNEDKEIDLFNNLSDTKEYSVYRVYTVKEDDTIELILDKFKVPREILADYNDLDNLTIGSKIIIPSLDE